MSYKQVNAFNGECHRVFVSTQECIQSLIDNGDFEHVDDVKVHVNEAIKSLPLFRLADNPDTDSKTAQPTAASMELDSG